jgi:iron-sulfur cluster repair protein YtfE (RIC family)
MEYDRMLAELFQEEDRAREMADKLMKLAHASRAEAVAELPTLLAFLHGPMERHMAHEEKTIFPQLDKLGLGPEVQVAEKQHASIRQATERLSELKPGTPEVDAELAKLVFDVARLMMHHTNFEGDYIYPELTVATWRDLMKESIQ